MQNWRENNDDERDKGTEKDLPLSKGRRRYFITEHETNLMHLCVNRNFTVCTARCATNHALHYLAVVVLMPAGFLKLLSFSNCSVLSADIEI